MAERDLGKMILFCSFYLGGDGSKRIRKHSQLRFIRYTLINNCQKNAQIRAWSDKNM